MLDSHPSPKRGDNSKERQESATYDAIYREGGYEGVYKLPYYHSVYYPLFKDVVKALQTHRSKRVLEVGCGPGTLAQMIFERTEIQYQGFDFSPVAVEKARLSTHRSESFAVGNALEPSTYIWDYDTLVCTEVLEHIENDLGVIQNWKPGSFCVCSVPNFDADTHVRFFRSKEQVLERYGSSIEIEKIWKRKRPAISDLTWRNYFRELRWHRYQPRELLKILGVGEFDEVGGWYIFTGRKRENSR